MNVSGTIIGARILPWIKPSTGRLQTTSEGYPLYLRAILVELDTGGQRWFYTPLRTTPFKRPAPHWN